MEFMNTPIQKACDLLGAAYLAKIVGVSQQAIYGWRTGDRPVPISRCAAIELATNKQVTRQQLRPDDWQKIWPELCTQTKKVAPV